MTDNEDEYDYAKLLKLPEWRQKRDEIVAKSPHCKICGRRNRRFAVHHRSYIYGRLPWDYPDDTFMVVCDGSCHREADETREEQETDFKNFERFGWQWELGKKETIPRERELRKLANYETSFKAWLVREEIPPKDWDWSNPLYPIWWFWNQFSHQFLAEQKRSEVQGWLF